MVLRSATEVCSSAAVSLLNLKVIKDVGNSIDINLYERLIHFGEVVRLIFLFHWDDYQVVEDGMALLRLLKLFDF